MIYLHIPFCHRKCTYCAFYSVATERGRQRYVDALCCELEKRAHSQQQPVRTIYFGGGTPSILSVTQLGQVIETMQRCYNLSSLEECTLEANPEDLTPQYLSQLRELDFFNRISIGVQSFHDNELRLLNRRHSAAQARQAVADTHAAGFGNISVDLIYGLPGQTQESWRDNLREVEVLPVQHLSAYALTVEEGTILACQIGQGKVPAPDEEAAVLHYKTLVEWAGKHGFEQYEVSNFCRQGFRSRHNSRYWDRTPYMGVGAAAHSFDGEYRRWNVADVDQYCTLLETGHVPHEWEQLTLRDAHNEYLMTALRTTDGIAKSLVLPPFVHALEQKIKKFVDGGLLVETDTHYLPTADGLLHADGMAADLFE